MNHELFFSLLFGIFIFDSFSKKPFPPRFITKSRLVMEEIESPRPPDVCRRLLPYRAQVINLNILRNISNKIFSRSPSDWLLTPSVSPSGAGDSASSINSRGLVREISKPLTD